MDHTISYVSWLSSYFSWLSGAASTGKWQRRDNVSGFIYQIKNIRRDKLCILTFLLPIIVGLALQLMSGISFSSLTANSFGILKGQLPAETVEWLESIGLVSQYNTLEELQKAVNDPTTQLIGVLADMQTDGRERTEGSQKAPDETVSTTRTDSSDQNTGRQPADAKSGLGSPNYAIMTIRSGDELKLTAVVADTLPKLYEERHITAACPQSVIPIEQNHDFLQSLLIVITLVTALFMGCTFNAMSMISEKEEGIIYINRILPMKRVQYIIQKMMLGFLGSITSTLMTAVICIRFDMSLMLPVILLIILSAFIAALTGLLIGHFSNGLMVGIVYIKIVMLLLLALPILCYLYLPSEGILRNLSYLLPSGATFYGFMDLLNGQPQDLGIYLTVLAIHCFGLFTLYLVLYALERKSYGTQSCQKETDCVL